jgi:hypothetical protein
VINSLVRRELELVFVFEHISEIVLFRRELGLWINVLRVRHEFVVVLWGDCEAAQVFIIIARAPVEVLVPKDSSFVLALAC